MKDKQTDILLVEDDPALQDAYSMILASQGFKVVTANNGVAAFDRLKNFIPDIILLDYFMPVMNGKTFLEHFEFDKYQNTKIIVATNVSEQKVLDEMLELGAHACLLKSGVSPAEMISIIQTVAEDNST